MFFTSAIHCTKVFLLCIEICIYVNTDRSIFFRPVSAYALFFRDTQAAIKGQNPNASFGEVSKIVASMWDALDSEHKNVSLLLLRMIYILYYKIFFKSPSFTCVQV